MNRSNRRKQAAQERRDMKKTEQRQNTTLIQELDRTVAANPELTRIASGNPKALAANHRAHRKEWANMGIEFFGMDTL